VASVKRNIIANVIGKVWSAAIVILLIPFYIKYLGIESYGLIGFYATLIGSMVVLDLGLSTTLSRELATSRAQNKSAANIRDLVFSLECIYWSIGILLSLLVVILSGFIATHWVNTEHLSPLVVKQSVMLMGVIVAFQWPISLYSGGLTGIEKQVLGNVILVIMTTLRAAGVLVVIIFFSRSVESFFLWQAITTCLYVVAMRYALWKALPFVQGRPRFSKIQIKAIWRFAAGMTGIGVVTFFLTQIDKILLSKILPLSQFGYYTLAFSIASTVGLLTGPISIAYFPRLAGFFSAGKEDELRNAYHTACRLITVLLAPFCFFLIFFMKDILLVWTKDALTTSQTSLLAQLLICGYLFNALMTIPYQLLIATGWTKFAFIQNTIAAILVVPLLIWLAYTYGAIGAAFVWLVLNASYIFISQPLIHRRLLKSELQTWYLNDTLFPMIPSLICLGIIRLLLSYFLPNLHLNLFVLGSVFLIALLVSAINLPGRKKLLSNLLKKPI
jgi:O-antigen/teichoic acid export membrane protein